MRSESLPKISVITVSYNQAKFIETTILSVLDQRYPNLEYIIIDGGSTDGSVDIIKKYAGRLTYWVSEKDAGQYDAINKGFSKSTGDILAFINADDFYMPWTLRTVASIFSSLPEVEWITALAPFQTNSEGLLFASGTMNPVSKKAFLDGLYIPGLKSSVGVIVQEGTFWTRGLWEKAGARIDTQVSLAGDFDLWCKFFEFAEPYCLGYPLAAMTRHRDQRSNMLALYIQQCNESLVTLRDKLHYKFSDKALKRSLLRIYRSNRLAWIVGKRLLKYYAWIIEAKLDANFTVSWNTKKDSIHIR